MLTEISQQRKQRFQFLIGSLKTEQVKKQLHGNRVGFNSL